MRRLSPLSFALVLTLTAASTALRAESLLHQSGFRAGAEDGWKPWSPRPEIAPRAFVDGARSRGESGALVINGASNPAAHGGWHRVVSGIRAGEWLKFRAYYQAENIAAENWQVVARLDWRDAAGKRASQPDYMSWARRDGNWTELSGEAQAPEGAVGVEVQLQLLSAAQGTVWWDDVSLDRMSAPAPRKVVVASVNLRPRDSANREASVARFAEAIGKQVPANADLIVLPEGISVVGTRASYVEVAEPVPGGPTTQTLGAIARQRKAYIVAGIYEREGTAIYNTAVLIDRKGDVVGKYRKVYLPREEIERGLTPGLSYPVFDTDFGKVGLMICYDVFFPDPARALATQGADLIAMPIWGGDENLTKARAIENGIYLVASGYDHPTYIMDPLGERLSQAREQGSVAVASIDLAKRFHLPWLGEMRTRRLKEIRVDVPQPVPGLTR